MPLTLNLFITLTRRPLPGKPETAKVTMRKVIVLDQAERPLMPCHPGRARELLRKNEAAVYKAFPFTVILKNRGSGDTQSVELKFDPGSKTTGVALVAETGKGKVAIFAASLFHRGQAIKGALESRRAIRRSRRNRKTRYRKPRFENRTRPKGWLPPSIKSRVDNVLSFSKKLVSLCPVSTIEVETVRFDTQKIDNPEISGTEYQQGELFGYEVREYLLEKWGRQCAYCQKRDIPLEIEHIVPKSKGGSDRVSNLAIACRPCNERKGNKSVKEFLKKKTEVLRNIMAKAKTPLKDVAAVNATRYAIGNVLKSLGLPVSFWSGGRTKHNRVKQGHKKDHWIDAVCVGKTGEKVFIPVSLQPLAIKAVGRGSRQMCRVDKFGFPRTKPKQAKKAFGFQTGDIVKAIVTKGKKIGTYFGKVAVRSSGSFNITTSSQTVQGISRKYCNIIHHADGYAYLSA